jgi:hypothetical protein
MQYLPAIIVVAGSIIASIWVFVKWHKEEAKRKKDRSDPDSK